MLPSFVMLWHGSEEVHPFNVRSHPLSTNTIWHKPLRILFAQKELIAGCVASEDEGKFQDMHKWYLINEIDTTTV